MNYNYNNNNDNERSRREWRQAASDLIARESRSAQQSRREPDSHGAEYARQYMREMGMPSGERDASARGDSRNDTRRNTYESRPRSRRMVCGKELRRPQQLSQSQQKLGSRLRQQQPQQQF